MTKQGEFKSLQIRIPTPLWEAFYLAFPGRGQRRLLIERFIAKAIEEKDNQDCFIDNLLRGEE